jgi:hypothetical protein
VNGIFEKGRNGECYLDLTIGSTQTAAGPGRTSGGGVLELRSPPGGKRVTGKAVIITG